MAWQRLFEPFVCLLVCPLVCPRLTGEPVWSRVAAICRGASVQNVTAVILGGGQGKRLRPLTLYRAKPAVALAGKYRLIDVPISNCIHSGIKKMFVVTQFSSVSLHRHIKQTYAFDPFSDGFIDLLAAAQTRHRDNWFQGTADAVRGGLRHINYFKADAALILSGDHLYRMDYRRVIDAHERSGADLTLAVCPVNATAAPSMGLVRANSDGLVCDFVEKPQDMGLMQGFVAPAGLCRQAGHPDNQDLYLANMGIYVFKREVLTQLLENGDEVDFGREVIPKAMANHKVMSFLHSGYWRDIGTIKDFFEANISMAQPKPEFELYKPGWPIYTHGRSLPPCRVVHSTIVDSLLSEGSNIEGAQISDSVIGVRSIVKPGTSLNEVVMHGADYYDGDEHAAELAATQKGLPPLGIGRDCQISRAIIDKNARIGDGVVIESKSADTRIETENYSIIDGITVIPGGAVIPAGTII